MKKNDAMHILTEERLKKIESHIQSIYTSHQLSIKKIYRDYFSQFKKRDEMQRKKLENNLITESDYRTWRLSTIMSGDKWSRFQNQVSKEMLNAKMEAVSYINSQLKYVYADNYNFIGKIAERAINAN